MILNISRHILLLAVSIVLAVLLCISQFSIYQVHEDSMEPLLRNGQKILALKWKHFKKGDILIFKSPEDQKLVVKKCLLSPGDPVVIKKGTLVAPGQNLPLTAEQQKKLSRYSTIPKDMFFAVGENTFNSRDSREYGPVPVKNLMGRVLFF